MTKTLRNIILLSIVLISFLMHFNHFSKDLISFHSWRQTYTQSNIINFYEEDMNILNPRKNDRGDTDGIFRLEFPIMQWSIACLYKLFGNHLIISRLFVFIIGLFSVLGIYRLLFAVFKKETLAVIGAWTFNFSPAFYFYTINPMPDNLALCSSIWGITFFFYWYNNKKLINLILCGLLLCLGTLAKLPFIVYYIVPFTYFVLISFKVGLNKKVIIQFFCVFTLVILPMLWYIKAIPQWNNNPIVKGMFDHNFSIATILDYLLHNLISTLPELLLNYGSLLFFLAGFFFLFKRKAFKNPKFPLFLTWSILLVIYYLLEANAIARVHDYYLFPFYPLLFFLVAFGAYHFLNLRIPFWRYLTWFLLILLPFTCYLRMQNRWNPESPGFNRDLLVYKKELMEAVPKHSLVVAGNDISHSIFFYHLDKKGWGFHNDLTSEKLKTMIDKGAEYLYTDSKDIVNKNDIACYLDKLILERGTIRIYSLKKSARKML